MHQGNLIGYAVGGAVFIVVLGFRMRRMMQSRPFQLRYVWILPLVFVALTALILIQTRPVGAAWIWIAASFVIGAGLGWLRAKTIRLEVDPATRMVKAQGSPVAMMLLLAIFAVRFLLRGVLAAESSALGINAALIDSAFLTLACGLFVARAAEMGLRARGLLAESLPTA
jgi:hypothetical protein